MFAPIIAFAGAVALVAIYIFIVNRLLRSDEHWNDDSQPVAPATRARPEASAQASRPASFTPNHA